MIKFVSTIDTKHKMEPLSFNWHSALSIELIFGTILARPLSSVTNLFDF